MAAAAPAPAGRWLEFVESIDGGLEGNAWTGRADTRFRRPVAVAARDSVLYVVDEGQELLYAYDRFSGRLSVVRDLRGLVAGEVRDIYVTGDRSIYLADSFGARVVRLNASGEVVRIYQDQLNLRRPVAVAVDERTGDVYVADGVMDYVLVFNDAGRLWRSLGERGEGEGRFLNITSVALGPEGVYVTARLALRGQVLDGSGAFKYALEKNTVVFPKSVAVDVDGRAYISDFFDNSISIFRQGRLLAKLGGTGVGPGRFKGIADVSLEAGFLYVADSLNGRIQVFRILTRGRVEPAAH
ncbi:MAG TPA: hypothetical protein ENJ19_08820 [Gammaproteobacteria bacterium]|nr:hypothetical protein [Gammaproteobacteria bacterium]